MKPIQLITRKYRSQRDLSLRDFAKKLSEDLVGGEKVSHQTIKNWEDGVHKPDFSFLVTMALTKRDWRGDFALDCLATIRPQIYEPMTSIGREALEKCSVLSETEKEK